MALHSVYPSPNSDDLIQIPGCYEFMEYRKAETLIWPDDWWDGCPPIGVLTGRVSEQEAMYWVIGHREGMARGEAAGRKIGFDQCQAGFRALLGAAAASDVGVLLQAAKDAKEG